MLKITITELGESTSDVYICESGKVDNNAKCVVMNNVHEINGFNRNCTMYLVPIHVIRHTSVEEIINEQ